jgi:hypothetical protein
MKSVGKIAAGVGAAIVATTGAVAISGSAAMAAPAGPCYAVGSYSFKDQVVSSTRSDIHVFRGGSCSGGEIANGRAGYAASTSSVTLTAQDIGCDSVGITVFAHGHSVASTGCATNNSTTHPYSSYGNPKNFWVRVGSSTNSHAIALPNG